jgi:DNA-binding CsgD family transcriptional regulator
VGAEVAGGQLPISSRELSDLLLLLHRAAYNPAEVENFLAACGRYIDAISGAISVCEVRSGKWRYIGFVPSGNANAVYYEERYASADPVREAVARAAPHRFYLRNELLTPQMVANHPYFAEWYARLGYDDICVARFPVSNEYNCHFGFIRALGQPPFTRRELDFLELLLPHVEYAVAMHNRIDRLSIFADIAQEQLLQSGQGLIVLNAAGYPIYMNRVAARMQQDGSPLKVVDGQLQLPGDAGARFGELVRRCIAISRSQGMLTSGSLTVERAGASPLAVSVQPFRLRKEHLTVLASEGRAIVVLFDPDRPRLDIRKQLREMYHFSEAEADVCWRIGNGETVEDIAGAINATRETVRSQIKRVFAKTGVNRQPDLVRLVLLGPAGWNRVL